MRKEIQCGGGGGGAPGDMDKVIEFEMRTNGKKIQ